MYFNSTLTVLQQYVCLFMCLLVMFTSNFVGWFVCLSLFDFTNFTRDSQEI